MTMDFEDVISGKNITKGYAAFKLSLPELHVPKGFATALIGENGAGKTTLLDILAGIRLDAKGEVTYFGKYQGVESDPYVKNAIGYLGGGNYYLPQWTVSQVCDITKILFDSFDQKRFDAIAEILALDYKSYGRNTKKVSELSEGNKVKLMLSAIIARKTQMLMLDEPASPLDPLMRDRLCDIIREYLNNGQGERSVFFSTHNVADMESVTDYVMIMEQGQIVEEGFVEDLKEKYIVIKGEAEDAKAARNILYSISEGNYGFSGLCLADRLNELAGLKIQAERTTLSDICVGVMKHHSRLKLTEGIEI